MVIHQNNATFTVLPFYMSSEWYSAKVLNETINLSATQLTASPTSQKDEIMCQRYSFVMYTVICGSLCIFGLIGNAVTFAVFCVDRLKTSTSFLFQCLSVIDSLLLITAFPLYVLSHFVNFTGLLQEYLFHYHAYVVLCLLPCIFIVQTATIWLTVVVGVNRYVAVCHPYQASRLCSVRQAKLQLLVVLICSVIYNIPKFFVGYPKETPDPSTACDPLADSNESNVTTVTSLLSNVSIVTTMTSLLTSNENFFELTNTTLSPLLDKKSTSLLMIRVICKSWLGNNMYFNIIYNNALYLIFLLGLPLLILTYLNARLVRSLHELKKKRAKMQVYSTHVKLKNIFNINLYKI